MQVYTNPVEYLSGPRLYPTPDQDVSRSILVSEIKSCLANLSPEQCRVRLTGKSLAGSTDKIAPYYGTQYSEQSLPEETAVWSRVRSDPSSLTLASTNLKLFLPPENIFIPRNFDLLSPPLSQDVSESARLQILNQHPEVIRSDDKFKVWYKLDKSFAQPKAYLVVNLAISKTLYDPAIVMASRLWSSCFLNWLRLMLLL
jgi:secreted Zn-dependent insulinase-like peptidase